VKTVATLVKRNLRLFLRDRIGVFLSLLSALILFVLYAFFLGNPQLDAITENFPSVDPSDAQNFVNAWVFSGIAMITTLTTSLGACAVFLDDRTTGRFKDFLITPARRTHLTAGYLIASLLIAFVSGLIVLAIAEAYIAVTGGPVPGISAVVAAAGYLFLLSAAFAALSTFLVSLVRSSGGFSSLSAIVGTLVGFLAGAYIPLGALPLGVVNVLNVLPFSQAAMLVRSQLTPDSTEAMTQGNQQAIDYINTYYGVTLEVGGHNIPTMLAIGTMIVTCLIFLGLSILRIRLRLK
jgi:multidrug/hemolysin transport system permease protein